MLQIVWNDEARNDLGSIIRYIAERNPPAAKGLKSLIEAAVMPAVEHPLICIGQEGYRAHVKSLRTLIM